MSEEERIEAEEYLEYWLENMMEVYGDILDEWQSNEIVQERPDASVDFACNNCGKCCEFEDHYVWIYPSDLTVWLKNIDTIKIVPLLLGILFPVEDNDGFTGYAIPSQAEIKVRFQEAIQATKEKTVKKTLNAILTHIKKINPGFKWDSNYCIFYNKDKTDGHCTIWENRPLQCRVYPYDFVQFSKIEIPEAFSEKYGTLEEDINNLPLCPSETYSGDPKKGIKFKAEDAGKILLDITMEKANYLTSEVTQSWEVQDISELLIELFHSQIINLANSYIIKNKHDKNKRYVAGARPQKKH